MTSPPEEREDEFFEAPVELQVHQLDSYERVAMKSLESEERQTLRRQVFIVSMLIVSGCLALAFIYLGAKDILIEVLKLSLAFGAGVIGGYHVANRGK